MECLNCINSCLAGLYYFLLPTSLRLGASGRINASYQIDTKQLDNLPQPGPAALPIRKKHVVCVLVLLCHALLFCAAFETYFNSSRTRCVHSGAPASEINAFAAQLSPIRPSTKMTCTKPINRRKFRSQTSDNMDMRRVTEEKRRREQRKSQKKEGAGARKSRKCGLPHDLWLPRVEK